MSITNIFYSHPNHLETPLPERSSLLGKFVTKVHTTTSYLIASIHSLARLILSYFIYVGSWGRYTLNAHFSLQRGLGNSASCANIQEVVSKRNQREDLRAIEENKAFNKVPLKRHASKLSVSSNILRNIRSERASSSLYPNLAEMVTLSTCVKTPEQRLAELERQAELKSSLTNT